jgi:hypothetical protein
MPATQSVRALFPGEALTVHLWLSISVGSDSPGDTLATLPALGKDGPLSYEAKGLRETLAGCPHMTIFLTDVLGAY